ncbi:hypothetical protein BCR33DRAFT_342278 [Rhizoclosmatium globosum]|uniref:Receptor ligand binding region domain-containing protein n=1 Tax=Rhizoclosmatium globosum TaxID=329046 RepID=A0A1Y2C4G8_9FUNG|nr:hypothetical protein BCR33DRAFT_342278 [Rhizoclosmatium globosum]|eukprot:ORY41215.1 hypothetical protein BCR33DRAFT_342278 [Rhizoclosmatium globosum]
MSFLEMSSLVWKIGIERFAQDAAIMSLHCDCVEEGRTCDGIVCAGRIRKSGVAKTRWNTLKPKRHTTICLLQQLYLLAIVLHIGCLPMALAGKSSLEPDTSNLPAWRNQKAQLSSNIVPRDPVITLPQRTRSQNNTLPTLSLFFPIPDLSARSAALVSSMIMTLDDIQTAILPSLWVDLVVSVVNNRSDAINQAKFAITNKKVSGFVGNAQYAEIVDVADQYNLPICDGSDDSILLSNHADYPMFFRTRPTDKNQIRAIYSFVSSRGWNQISIVTSSDFADSSLFFTEASAYGLEIKATFMMSR